MNTNTVSSELYTRAACEPPHSELTVTDPTEENAQQAIAANTLEKSSGKEEPTEEAATPDEAVDGEGG